MSILKINNSFNSSKHSFGHSSQNMRLPVATVNSSAVNESNTADDIVSFNKLSDKDMYLLASQEPNHRMISVAKNAVKALVLTVPVIDTVLSGLFKGGSLSTKTKATLLVATGWISALAVVSAVFGVKKNVNSRSEFLNDFDKKHHYLSTAIDFATVYAGYNLLKSTAKESKELAKKHFTEQYNSFNNGVKAPIKKLLDNSVLNKKVVAGVDKFLTKRPYLNNMSKAAILMFIPASLVSILVRFNKEENSRNKQIESNMAALKLMNDMIPDDNC